MTTDGQTWNAADYARNASAQRAWARELIAKLGLRGDEAVLDLGCGDGQITAEIAAAVPRGSVLGIDAAAAMIALAEERFPASQHPTLRFRQMDATALALPRAFDVAFSNAALHWVQDHAAVLRGVRAGLRPGGRLLFQMGGAGNAAEVLTVVGELLAEPQWRAHFAGFAPPYHFPGVAEYEALLAAAGFVVERVELLPKDMTHAHTDGLLGWLRTTWFPFTNRVPEGQREAWLAEVLQRYLARRPADAAGRTHVAMVRLEVAAHVPA